MLSSTRMRPRWRTQAVRRSTSTQPDSPSSVTRLPGSTTWTYARSGSLAIANWNRPMRPGPPAPRSDAAGGRKSYVSRRPRALQRESGLNSAFRQRQRPPFHQGSVQASRTVGRALAGQLVRDSPLLTAELATGIDFRRCEEDEGSTGRVFGTARGGRWMPGKSRSCA